MNDLQVNLSLPRDLLGIFNVPESQLSKKILQLVTLDLFRQQLISAGKGGEILGVSKWEFIQLLGRQSIPYFNENPDELSAEIAVMEELLGERTI